MERPREAAEGRRSVEALWAQIERLQAQVNALQAEVRRLRAQLQGGREVGEREVRRSVVRERQGDEQPRERAERPRTEREGVRQQIEVMNIALHGLKEAERGDAAELLGAAAESVTLRRPEYMNSDTLKTCAFEDATTGRSISYSLTRADSVEEMIEDLWEERQNVGLAQTSIEAVMGEESGEATSYEIPGLGDEAFYAAVNGTVVVRVGNVRVQVMNAPDLEIRKATAARVASRLRQG